ncbi:MAG: riboflavin synthase [Gammaproteobacteria bacterium]|nr:riboflavin synthase [Gammaproteobacteria bacterium]
MFTGIVQDIGRVAALERRGGDARLHIRTHKLPLGRLAIGDSIATGGVCLTAVALPGDGFVADVSGETLAKTTMGGLRPGDEVNLELALTPDTPLGGHLVSGHVDGVGELKERRQDGRSVRMTVGAPAPLARYIATKGSICVDGVSLTVNAVAGAAFELNIVPHTLAQTTLGGLRTGDPVNLEVDVIARYLERLLLGDEAADPATALTREFLARHGFGR